MDETKKNGFGASVGSKNNNFMNNNGHEHEHDHGPWCYGWHGGHNFHRGGLGFWIAKVLFFLAALLFMFWLGVKMGEIKSFYHGGPQRGNFLYFQKQIPDGQGMMYNTQGGVMNSPSY